VVSDLPLSTTPVPSGRPSPSPHPLSPAPRRRHTVPPSPERGGPARRVRAAAEVPARSGCEKTARGGGLSADTVTRFPPPVLTGSGSMGIISARKAPQPRYSFKYAQKHGSCQAAFGAGNPPLFPSSEKVGKKDAPVKSRFPRRLTRLRETQDSLRSNRLRFSFRKRLPARGFSTGKTPAVPSPHLPLLGGNREIEGEFRVVLVPPWFTSTPIGISRESPSFRRRPTREKVGNPPRHAPLTGRTGSIISICDRGHRFRVAVSLSFFPYETPDRMPALGACREGAGDDDGRGRRFF